MSDKKKVNNIGIIDDTIFSSIVKTELQKLIEKYKTQFKKGYWFDYFYKTEGCIVILLLIFLVIGKIILLDNDVVRTINLIILLVVISVLTLVFSVIYYESKKAESNVYINKINKSLSYLSQINNSKRKKHDIPFDYYPNSNFIYIFRNKEWVLLPSNLIIKDDIFLLRAGGLIPCDCVEYNIEKKVFGKEYKKNEILMPLNINSVSLNLITKYSDEDKIEYLPSFHLYSFVSHENITISIIEKYIDEQLMKKKKKMNTFPTKIMWTHRIYKAYFFVWITLFVLSWTISLIHLLDIKEKIVLPEFVKIYLVIYSVLMSLTLLPFFHRAFSELIYGYSNSLNMIFENYFKEQSYDDDNFSSSYDFSSTTNSSGYSRKRRIGILYTIKNTLQLILRGIKIDKLHLNILSECTLLCFLDSSGIIVNTNHSIKEICIYNSMNNKSDVNDMNTKLENTSNNDNHILTIIDIFMDNKSMYAYQRIQNIKILHSLFLISYYTQIPKYMRQLDNFQNNIFHYMNETDYSYLYICLCDLGNCTFTYNKFVFQKLFFCIENKSDYRLYKKKYAQVKKYRKSEIGDDEIPYNLNDIGDEEEEEESLGINIYDDLTQADNFVFIFILYEKKKDKYHMFLKGELEALVSKCMYYFDGKLIKKLKIRKKKELKILNMQWVSSGIESICFAYRPLSSKEALYLKQNFKKNIYILTINKKKVYNIKNFYDGEYVATKDNEKFLSHLLSTTIFIGNSAVKLMTNNEIQTRINDFYDAGIRFVYFSRSDEINTRNIANLLGMETSWNTSISLSLNGTKSFKNREGKVVIPSGINNIKKHIEEIDDIPLRVSLYSGCNKFNTMEMIKILLQNNEVITCIGNSLNSNNFPIFNLCNYSIAILLPFNSICRDCYGKKEKSNPFEDYSCKRNPLLMYSSYINSFPCHLIIEKNNIDLSENAVELVYKLIKSSRVFKKNISLILFHFYFYYSLLSFLLFIMFVCFLPPFISMIDYLLFILIIIPVSSICLFRNDNNATIMNEIPEKTMKSEHIIKNMAFFFIKWVPMLLYSSSMGILYVLLINKNFIEKYVTGDREILRRMREHIGSDSADHLIKYCSKIYFIRSLYKCHILMEGFWEKQNSNQDNMISVIIQQSQIFFFFYFSIFYFICSLSFSDKYESLFRFSCIQNCKEFFISLILFLILSLVYVVVRILLLPSTYMVQYPDILLVSLLVVFSVLILATNEIIKKIEEKIEIHRQKYLKVLFGTRLGMWSPK